MLVEVFLTKFFPPQLTSQLRAEITQFRQGDQGTLYDVWDRFRELLRKCPQHGFELSAKVQTFYNGLNYSTRALVDSACGGLITTKTAREANQLFEELAKNHYQAPSERNTRRRQ